jgi:hypothetical protein
LDFQPQPTKQWESLPLDPEPRSAEGFADKPHRHFVSIHVHISIVVSHALRRQEMGDEPLAARNITLQLLVEESLVSDRVVIPQSPQELLLRLPHVLGIRPKAAAFVLIHGTRTHWSGICESIFSPTL